MGGIIPYILENNPNVLNHQPVIIVPIIIWLVVDLPYIETHTYIWVNNNNSLTIWG